MKKILHIFIFYIFFLDSFIFSLFKNKDSFLVDLFDLEKNSVSVKNSHKDFYDLFRKIKKDYKIKE